MMTWISTPSLCKYMIQFTSQLLTAQLSQTPVTIWHTKWPQGVGHHGRSWKADREERTNYCWSQKTLVVWSGVIGHWSVYPIWHLWQTPTNSVGCVYKINPVQVQVWKNNKKNPIIYKKTVVTVITANAELGAITLGEEQNETHKQTNHCQCEIV